jgi:hypothetical protein
MKRLILSKFKIKFNSFVATQVVAGSVYKYDGVGI